MSDIVNNFKPFENDSQVANISQLSIENGEDFILLVGDLEIHRNNPTSKAELQSLIALLQKIEAAT